MKNKPTDLENPLLKYASVNHYFKLFNKSQLDKIMSKPDNFKAELKREQIINRAIVFCNNPLPNYLKFKN
mgnify:CR=1 FL=1